MKLKNFLTLTLLTVFSLWLALTFFPTSPVGAVQLQTASQQAASPCQFQPGDFAMPQAPECSEPPAGYWDCVIGCAQAYKQNRADNANRHCRYVEDMESARCAALSACSSAYNQCINAGHSEGYCSTARGDCTRFENAFYDALIGQSERDRDAADAAALEGFTACAKACCSSH